MTNTSRANSLYVAALICYIVGCFLFVTSLPSIVISLVMVKKGYIKRRMGEVVSFAIIELLAWLFVLTFSWYFQCYTYSSYSYSGSGYTYQPYQSCMWWGWTSIVVWFVLNLAFGIPRIIFTRNFDGALAMDGVQIVQGFPMSGQTVVMIQQPNYAPQPKMHPSAYPSQPGLPGYYDPQSQMPAAQPFGRKASLETLAVQLNLPQLIGRSSQITTQQLAQMHFNQINAIIPMTAEEFIRLKQALQ